MQRDLIEPYWNVKQIDHEAVERAVAGFNRTILECKGPYLTGKAYYAIGFNRTILECKDFRMLLNVLRQLGFNRTILECKDSCYPGSSDISYRI